MENFLNILALKFLQIIDRMNVLHSRLDAGKRAYYALENTCNLGDIKCSVLKKYLFDTLVTPVLLYGVELWGGTIPKSTWKEF